MREPQNSAGWKEVPGGQFLVAKFVGLVLALTVLTYVNLLGTLLASRMAFDAYGSTDLFAVGIFAVSVVLAYLLAGFSNFFLRRPFVSDAVFCLVLVVTVGFIDPGNWASNIAAGSQFGYVLLWMVTLSTIMLIVLQHNVAHLGIARAAKLAAVHGHEARAEAFEAAVILVARRLVDPALPSERRLERLDREAVRCAAAIGRQAPDDADVGRGRGDRARRHTRNPSVRPGQGERGS